MATIDNEQMNAQTSIKQPDPEKPVERLAKITIEIPAYENFSPRTFNVPSKKAYAIYMKLLDKQRVE